jgi:hypothetical protein
MKQLFYAVAAIVVLFFAVRLMSKVKDVPEEKPEHLWDDTNKYHCSNPKSKTFRKKKRTQSSFRTAKAVKQSGNKK